MLHPSRMTQAIEAPLDFESRSPLGPPLPGGDGDDLVVARVAALVCAVAPLRRALAAVAGRLVATRAWERLGFARLRDCAVERLGVSGRHLQELAHVDAALAELPQVDAALTTGRLSWTKARLLCRVATRESEGLWLDTTAGMSAQALAREVRAVDARALENGGAPPLDTPVHEDGPRQTVFLHCSAPTRGKWCFTRQVANRMAGERLAPWACAEAVAAEVLSAIGLDAQGEEEREGDGKRGGNREGETGGAPASPDEPSRSRSDVGAAAADREATLHRASEAQPPQAPASAAFIQPLLAGLEAADAFELDARLRRAVRLEARHLASLGPWLLAVASDRLFRDLGYRSFDAYARDELGMSAAKARALLRIERVALVSPAFRGPWRRGEISWTQAQALVPLLVLEESAPWHEAWIERAGRVTVRRLEEDVDEAIASGELDPATLPPLPAPFCAQVPAGLQTGAQPTLWGKRGKTVGLFFNAPRDVARLFRAVLATTQRRIERVTGRPSSEGEAFDAMLEHALESWGSCRAQSRRHRVFERDGWRCTVPGCTSYRNLQEHHIVFRSAGGTNELENRTTLCAWHHLRGIHAGVVRCEGEAPGELRFGFGGVEYTSGDWVLGGGPNYGG